MSERKETFLALASAKFALAQAVAMLLKAEKAMSEDESDEAYNVMLIAYAASKAVRAAMDAQDENGDEDVASSTD